MALMASRVPEGVFPRFLTDRGLDIRQPTIENQARQVARDVAAYLEAGGTITVIPPGTSGMVGPKGEYTAGLGAWHNPVSEKAPKQKPVKAKAKQQRDWVSHGTYRAPILCDTCGENAPWSSFRRVTGKLSGNVQQSAFTTCKPCRDIKRGKA